MNHYDRLSIEIKNKIALLYKEGQFMKNISKDLNVPIWCIRRVLQEDNITIVNYAKRCTPKNSFKKGVSPHNKGTKLENLYGENRARKISKKIASSRLNRSLIEIFGSVEKVDQFYTKRKITCQKNKEKISLSHSEEARKRWANGVYDDVQFKFKRTKWYDHIRKHDNKRVKVQGKWELELAQRLDFLNVQWLCHGEINERFYYINLENKRSSYKPDFKVINSNIFLDPHWDFSEKQVHKFESVRREYKNINLILLTDIKEVKNFSIEGE